MVYDAQLWSACSGVERDGWNNRNDEVFHLACEQAESNLRFAGFPAFHCPLKEDTVETLKTLVDPAYKVRVTILKIL